MSTGERVYHTPESPWYDRTEIDTDAGERWFCTEQEAQAAGWRPPNTAQSAPTPTPAPTAETPTPAACETVVNINTADIDELQTLPNIGPARAQAIIDHRNTHGDFGSIDALDDVDGIGEKTLAAIAPCVTLR